PVNLFKDEDLESFLNLATNATSAVLKTTFDVGFTNPDLVVEYAAYLALTSRSLLEKGREYAFEDHGIVLQPPNVSQHMFDVARSLIDNWFRKVQLIRA